MNFSFRKRIATHFMLATALIILLVFGTVYFIVRQTVYHNLDSDLSYETGKHLNEIRITENTIYFKNMNEWKESEHREVHFNPVFIQLVSRNGHVWDKSPNLKERQLQFKRGFTTENHFNSTLENRNIRQLQIPIKQHGKVKGYIVAAMSLEASLMVLNNLGFILIVLYPIILFGLFFITSFLAGRSIIPVVNISKTTNRITRNNLNERVALPASKDELYVLTGSINSLLERIQDAMQREQQFTSDASHELRTPLSVLRGTLEVLIRKPRTQEEYETKIQYSLLEIDRMANIIDQLLMIARSESNPELTTTSSASLTDLVHEILNRRNPEITAGKLNVTTDFQCNEAIEVHRFYAHLIIDNIIGNAIKYSPELSRITINVFLKEGGVMCVISDTGIGIKQEDLPKLFHPFFRSDALDHKNIEGTGLGLSIVQKAATSINATVSVSSEFGKGTTVTVFFKEILRRS
jgi:signal transduction histidine kinase